MITLVEPLFLKPVFHEKIFFGGVVDTLQLISVTKFQKGQLGISGHPHGPNIITNGQYKGQLLPKVYQQHPERLTCTPRVGNQLWGYFI